ncbi:hypothetical protein BGX31_009454 [Mortierella sp. GBA43]|nr:hypothetical protein BGX31_009454 [Mortierella sp. GBA43]
MATGITLQIPPTREELQVQTQIRYLRKFMFMIGTLPLIATLAVHNKLDIVMWWVIALPIIGISVAVYWHWKLGKKLHRLQEDTRASRLSLSRQLSRGSPSPQPFLQHHHRGEDSDAPPPPPDYQSSIITPPAYITAQQPRRVPSYRSLDQLFAVVRRGASILTRGEAAENTQDSTLPPPPPQDQQEQQQQQLDQIQSPGSQVHTMGDVQIVMVFEEQIDLSDVTSMEGQEPSRSSLETTHSMTEIDTIPEMTEYGSGPGEHTSRLWTGLYPTLDAEAGSSQGQTLTSGAGSSTTRIEATRPILSDDDGASLDLEEQPPKQATKDVKGKAPCRD